MTESQLPPPEPERKPATPEELAQAAKHRMWLITILAVLVLLPLVLGTLRLLGIV